MLRRIVLLLGGLVVALLLIVALLHSVGQARLAKAPNVPAHSVTIPTDAAAIARGEHLALISSCVGCHTPDLGGEVFIDGAPIGYLPAPNLTSGNGGIAADYSVEEWERAIRHGVGSDGRILGSMPAHRFNRYSDEDLGALIAYLQQTAPVDRELGSRAIAFPGTILWGILGASDLAVNQIDHEAAHLPAPAAEVSVEYGHYLLTIASCQSCHGPALDGVVNPGEPAGPNITPAGEIGSWSEADFLMALQHGTRPDGRQLGPEMPWINYGTMSETEAKAIWTYLQTVLPSQGASK